MIADERVPFFAICMSVIVGLKLAISLVRGWLPGEGNNGGSLRATEPGKFWINWSLLAIIFVISTWYAILRLVG